MVPPSFQRTAADQWRRQHAYLHVCPRSADGAIVGLRDGNLAGDLVARRIDEHRVVRAEASHQHLAPVRRDREAVRRRAYLDLPHDPIGRRVDDAHRGGPVAADVDLAPVRRDDQAVRARWDRDGAEHLVRRRVQHGDRIVLEQADISLRSRGRLGCHLGGTGGREALGDDGAATS